MSNRVPPGSNVSIIFYVDGRPVAVYGEVTQAEPFTVWTHNDGAMHLSEGRRAMLVIFDGTDFNKAEAELHSEPGDGGWTVVAKSFGWESVDRRRYPRFDVHVPISVRAVLELDNGPSVARIEGTTEDLSIGGAWVKTQHAIPSASLVEVTAELDHGVVIRALSIVKWADREHNGVGFGVEFLDFLDGSRYALHQFLNKKAA